MNDYFLAGAGIWQISFFLIEYIGLCIEFGLFLYLSEHLLTPKKTGTSSAFKRLLLILVCSSLHMFTEIISHRAYSVWVLTMLLVSFLYATIYTRSNIYMRLIICIVFVCNVIYYENIPVSLSELFKSHLEETIPTALLFFSIRRILLKLPLYFTFRILIKKNQISNNAQFPIPYLFCMLCISAYELGYAFLIPAGLTPFSPVVTLGFSILGIIASLSIYLLFNSIYSFYEKNYILSLQVTEYQHFETERDLVQKQYHEMKGFQHDYNKHLFYLDSLLEQKEYLKAHQYLQELHHYNLPPPLEDYCSHKNINLLLKNNISAAYALHIPYKISVTLPDQLTISDLDLCSLLSNLLSNAVTASTSCKNPYIDISITQWNAYLCICIINSTDYDVLKQNPSLRTSKKEKADHGYGIGQIKSIVKKYQGYFLTESKDSYFKVKVLLQNISFE